jgi:uncharacterized damage-inducible protein DinB
MNGEINMLIEFLETFKANRQLTYDILNKLSDEELKVVWTRPGLNSFAKNIREMIAVEEAFINAIDTREMKFDSVPDVFDFPEEFDRTELIKEMKKIDERFENVIKKIKNDITVEWFGMSISLETHITNLIAHEVFHQGMMVMALYQFNIEIPESWIESWSLPRTSK